MEIDPFALIARRVVHVIVIHLMRIDNSARSKTISKKFPSNFLRASGKRRKLRKSSDIIFRKNTQLSRGFILAGGKRKRGKQEDRENGGNSRPGTVADRGSIERGRDNVESRNKFRQTGKGWWRTRGSSKTKLDKIRGKGTERRGT